MSLNAMGIMLKPILAKYIEPLEADGTIDKLQRDIALIASSNAIPELATLVSELQEHNRLMRRLFDLIERAANEKTASSGDAFNSESAETKPCSNSGAAGFIGDHRERMLDTNGTD